MTQAMQALRHPYAPSQPGRTPRGCPPSARPALHDPPPEAPGASSGSRGSLPHHHSCLQDAPRPRSAADTLPHRQTRLDERKAISAFRRIMAEGGKKRFPARIHSPRSGLHPWPMPLPSKGKDRCRYPGSPQVRRCIWYDSGRKDHPYPPAVCRNPYLLGNPALKIVDATLVRQWNNLRKKPFPIFGNSHRNQIQGAFVFRPGKFKEVFDKPEHSHPIGMHEFENPMVAGDCLPVTLIPDQSQWRQNQRKMRPQLVGQNRN